MNIAHSPSDIIIRIKNASLASRKEALIPFSNMNKKILDILAKEGFVKTVSVEDKKGVKNIKVGIRYDRRSSIINGVKILSKPSLRMYKDKKGILDLERRGKHTIFVSTSQGVMTGGEARKRGLGGEVLFEIW